MSANHWAQRSNHSCNTWCRICSRRRLISPLPVSKHESCSWSVDVSILALGETGDEHEDDTGGAHTYEIDQKIMAFESLTTYAFQMRGKFAPWLAPCMQLSLNELSCSFSEDVREAAAL